MAKIEYVKEIDDLIKIHHVFATATDKAGLVGNERKDGTIIEGLPDNGLLGLLFEVNPDAIVVSTGGTAKLIAGAGYKVTEVSDYTGWPEMVTGLVKSMNPKLYVGMLAHRYTESDADYMAKHGVPSMDMVLANFYPFEKTVAENPVGSLKEIDGEMVAAFEIIRQNMDVGGPTAIHTSRKGFLGTAAATRPEDYVRFANDLRKYNGCISIDSRTEAMKNCSADLMRYYTAINEFMQGVKVEDVKAAYQKINHPAGGE